MESLALFRLMDAKMGYISHRQGVLANNIANGNTPGYQSFDVKAPDFKEILKGTPSPLKAAGQLTLTTSNHIPLQPFEGVAADAEAGTSYEVSPDGNAVDIEEQMLRASRNNSEGNIVTSLYAKQLALLRLAAGANGGR